MQALDERKHLMIEWPRVEGFVLDVRQRIRCDVSSVPSLSVRPSIEPTEVVVRGQMGWSTQKASYLTTAGPAETLTRERFYEEHRLQRTIFEIARDVTEVLAGGNVSIGAQPAAARRIEAARLLFPQVLAVVQEFVIRRIAVAPTARREEIALAQYRDLIVERLLPRIEPDTDAGERALLPRIDRLRPMGTTQGTQFRTTKKTQASRNSHVSHVVLDSSWEDMAAYYLDDSPYVLAWVKNDRIDFDIAYEFQGRPHRYFPDYLVRIDAGERDPVMCILEIKGRMDEQDQAKLNAALRWCSAINHHGGFGRWFHFRTQHPGDLRRELTRFHEKARAGEELP